MFRVRRASFIALIAVILVLGAVFVLRGGRQFRGVTFTPGPAPEFAFSAPYRGPVTLADYRGDAVLLTFGRPSCGAACNPQLAALKEAMDRLGPRREDVRVLFITLEPDRMNEQGLLAFVQDFDLGFTGLMGDSSSTAATARAYRAAFDAVPDSVLRRAATLGDETPAPDLTAPAATAAPRIYGVDRQGTLRVGWGPHDPAALARDIRTLLRF